MKNIFMPTKEIPTGYDLSVGVGRRYAIREAFGCGMRRRLRRLFLCKVAWRMICDHSQGIQKTILRPIFFAIVPGFKVTDRQSMYL